MSKQLATGAIAETSGEMLSAGRSEYYREVVADRDYHKVRDTGVAGGARGPKVRARETREGTAQNGPTNLLLGARRTN